MIALVLLAVAGLVAGFALGRARLGTRLLDWAEDAGTLGPHTWRYWIALPIAAVALVAVWTVHPRRSLANVRSWRRASGPDPIPQYDPGWAEKRHATDEEN